MVVNQDPASIVQKKGLNFYGGKVMIVALVVMRKNFLRSICTILNNGTAKNTTLSNE